MNKKAAQQLIRELLLRGKLSITDHAKSRMMERGFTTQDIMRALNHGTMLDGPMPTIKIAGFECTMRVQLGDRRTLEVPIVVNEAAARIIVKTVVKK